MALQPGSEIGRYRIEELLGRGGMGEVYRAWDERLRRDVALKLILSSKESDPERQQRLVSEARAASSVSHPGIVAVYDTGFCAGSAYIVSELLEGATLRHAQAGKPLPLRKALDYGQQIALALAAAHAKGILHRDLKPENIFVTADDRIKLLDFGLAKVQQSEPDARDLSGGTDSCTCTASATLARSGPESDAQTGTGAGTQTGVAVGTAGYMSPEQVRGAEVDARSDVFALGVVLYEMLSGQRAFAGSSAVDRAAAVLCKDPPPVDAEARVPTVVQRLVWRCLDKDPDARFSSARDVAFCLGCLADDSLLGLPAAAGSGGRSPRAEAVVNGRPGVQSGQPGQPGQRWRRWQHSYWQRRPGRPGWPRLPAWLLVAVVAAAATVVAAAVFLGAEFLGGQRSPRQAAPAPSLSRPLSRSMPRPTYRRLTFRRGRVGEARFVPDSRAVVYSAAFLGNPLQVFFALPGQPEARPIGPPGATLYNISPSSQLALGLSYPRGMSFSPAATLALMPLSGGPPREVEVDVWDADFAANGVDLAIVRRSEETMRLEYPIGRVRIETTGMIGAVRISPDGREVAFLHFPVREEGAGTVELLDANGRQRRLSGPWADLAGLAWAAGGNELWFAASDSGPADSIRAVSRAGEERLLVSLPANSLLMDVAGDGRVLLSTQQLRMHIVAAIGGQARDLSWLDGSWPTDLSDDGQLLLFNEGLAGGASQYACYLRRTAEPAALRLGDGWCYGLSPDGKWVLRSQSPYSRMELLPTGSGQARALAPGPITEYRTGAFFPDGRRLAIVGRGPARRMQLYVQDGDHSLPRLLGDYDFEGRPVSPDGKLLAAFDDQHRVWLLPVDGSPPRRLGGLGEGEVPIAWSEDGRSVYATARHGTFPLRIVRLDIDGQRPASAHRVVAAPDSTVGRVLATRIAGSGESYVVGYSTVVSDLFVTEGL